MVLTNFELWAADGSAGSNLPLDFETNNPHTRHLNPFDPRVVPQINSTNLNHLSSNGYYGFSYINAAHDLELNNNNNNNINNNNININNNNTSNINHNNYYNNNNNNNNNSTAYNFMANDVNGMNNTFTPTTLSSSNNNNNNNNFGSSAYAAGNAVNVTRCKKRFFVMHNDDNNDDVNLAANADCTAKNKNYYNNNYEVSAKRCRFDDDFSAQYCNDFFQLPSTQIATQSCLMDTEEVFEKNNNNIEKYEHNLNPQLQNQLTAQQHHNHQQMQSHHHQQQQQQQQHLYHHQQHYQDIQFATIKCHFNQNNNINNSSDTLALNKNHQTFYNNKNDFEKEYNYNNENNVLINKHKTNSRNNSIVQTQINDEDNDDVAANDFKVDDATLFAQLHGGCLHHHDQRHFNTTNVSSKANANNDDNDDDGIYTIEKDVIMNHHNVLQDENYYEEF